MWTLVVIILAAPEYQNGGYSTSVVVPGFTTEQACLNASKGVEIPIRPNARVTQTHSIQCLARDV